MSAISFLDLLGVSTIEEAAELWPTTILPLDTAEIGLVVAELEGALTFRNIRAGASGGAVGLTAEVLVGALEPTQSVSFASLPRVGFRPLATSGAPARLYAQQRPTGVEWIVEALPIEISLPDGMLLPLDDTSTSVTHGTFLSGQADTYDVTLKATGPSLLRAHIKLRVSEELDCLVEFATPVSIGPCRFSGIPCAAIHDLAFILTPKPSPAMDVRAEALEWVRHKLSLPPGGGAIAARTIDLFSVRSRLSQASGKANEQRPPDQVIEPVLEDLVLLGAAESPVPFPLHFTAGVRRSLGIDDNPNGIYDLTDRPVVLPIVKGSGTAQDDGLYLIVRQLLLRSAEEPDSLDDPQVAFVDLAISDDPQAQGFNGTIAVTDDWTVEAGFHVDPPRPLFTLFGAHVAGIGSRIGLSFRRLFDDNQETDFWDATVLVGDLVVTLGEPAASPNAAPAGDGPVKLEAASGKPTTIVVNDFGMKFGEFSIGNFWQADKAELKAAGTIRLSIDEFGFLTEPNGARYFSFSGTWPILGTPTVSPQAGQNASFSPGIQFHRLRWKIRGAEDDPVWLIDGLGLFLQYKGFSLIGSGTISDRREGSVRFREAGCAFELKFNLGQADSAKVFSIGGQFLYGRASGSIDYRYLLAGVGLSPIPIGAVSLVNLRGLFAWNMQPRLGPADAGTAQPMRLFEWAKAHAGAVAIPATRNVAATGWEARENAWAFAAGAGVRFGGDHAVTIEAFFLYLDSPTVKGFLAALELYLGGKKPIAYGVVEVEGDHWSVLVGLALKPEHAIGREIPFFNDAVALTGTFYATNRPATFAIGRLADTSSWLALTISGNLWIFKVRLFIGTCLEIVDTPDGPRVLAFRIEAGGGTPKAAIGSIDFSLAMQLTVGVWRSESRVAGFVQWLEGSIRINVLFVFRFGASFKVEWAFLGPDPAYRRIACEVHIHTPWWMPDKTFRWNRTSGQPELEEMATASSPLLAAAAHALAAGDPLAVPVSRLSDDPQTTFSIAQFGALAAQVIAEVPTAVAVDSTIALQFKAAVEDKLLWGQVTPPNVGLQTSGEVSTRYELVEIGIRRRPLSGGSSALWTTLLDPAFSRSDNLAGLTTAQVAERARSPVALRWDADMQRAQALDPRHLLVNAELPFLALLVAFENDENLVRTMPGWPCCPTFTKGEPEHHLNFIGHSIGARAPVAQLFSESHSLWRWLIVPPLIFAPPPPSGLPLARLPVTRLVAGPLASVVFDEPAASVSLDLRWKAMHLPRTIDIAAFRGLKLVAETKLELDRDAPPSIAFANDDGLTHLELRMAGRPVPDSAGITGVVDLVSATYRTVAAVRGGQLHAVQCGAFDPATGGNGSRFAWLPNHEYEIALRTRITVGHTSAGALAAEVPQISRFRTKGLPGSNAVSRTGEELEPYVESVYPAPGAMLYRREPAVLAFNERFDILQGLDRPPAHTDPPERQQRIAWTLTAEQVEGHRPPVRISASQRDWIVDHRGAGGSGTVGPFTNATFELIRNAVSLDARTLRFEALAGAATSCTLPTPQLRRSRVLKHAPVDPAAAGKAAWPPGARLRVNLRRADSPFVDRRGFEPADATAFTATGPEWTVVDGAIGPSGGPLQFAVFGDPVWRHFQAELVIAAPGNRAGLGIAALGGARLLVLVENGRLRLVRRQGDREDELAAAALVAESALPVTLTVHAYDDAIVARVGAAVLRHDRGEAVAGPLALAAEGEARFAALRIDGLDAYRFEFAVSRFDDFAAHAGSFSGVVGRIAPLASPTRSVAELLADGTLFATWVAALALPLRQACERLEIAHHADRLLLIESPEPLDGVAVRLRRQGSELAARVIAEPGGKRLLVVADAPLAGSIELELSLVRQRYRAVVPDAESSLRAVATLALEL
jgi:hypothetical protein